MGRVIALLAKYGKRAIDWAWANASRVAQWLASKSPEEVVMLIVQILGL